MAYPTPFMLRLQHTKASEPYTAVFRIGHNDSTEIHIRVPGCFNEDEAPRVARHLFQQLVAEAANATVHWTLPDGLLASDY